MNVGPPHFQERYRVRSYEVEPDASLRLVSLVRMLQEVAWQHASLLGKGFAEREDGAYFWVLSRLRLRIDRYPRWGDEIVIRTYPVGTEKLLALREFEIVDELDGAPAVIGRATTAWLIVDGGSGRPVRPAPIVSDLQLTPSRYDARPGFGLERVDEHTGHSAQLDGPYRVRHRDIDQYGHVNNASYLEWMVDAMSDHDVWQPPSDLAVDFLSETLPGDSYVVSVTAATGSDDSVYTEVRRVSDDRVAVRARLRVAPAGSR
ncbi:MAG: hypothetical protein EA382_06165 [Spirochaetaceae bacterium]|nr:MAG: hypothetical protein EA382_06165 [Spirochaetaceae bacterium]